MGEYLNQILGDGLVVLGVGFGGGEGWNGAVYGRAENDSADGLLGELGPPYFALDVRSNGMPATVRDELTEHRKVRMNDRYGELDVMSAYDALIYLDTVTPVHRFD